MFDRSQSTLERIDPEIFAAVQAENRRQEDHIELIASENYASPAVMAAQGTQLTNKYAEGYPGKRYYGGCEHVDTVETLAIERLKKLFGAEYANVQPHSGSQANAAVFLALLTPDRTHCRYVAVVESQNWLRYSMPLGSEKPSYATGTGRAMLAHLPAHELEALLDQTRFERITPDTVASRRAFVAALKEVRRRGVSTVDSGTVAGVTSVAAPIFDGQGRVAAALSAGGPTARMMLRLAAIEDGLLAGDDPAPSDGGSTVLRRSVQKRSRMIASATTVSALRRPGRWSSRGRTAAPARRRRGSS